MLNDPVDVMARTMWGEARGEGADGMRAVGCVIRNRANHPRWWGRDVVEVCIAPWQFSCWNKDDPNRTKCLNVSSDDLQFAEALAIADRIIYGGAEDTTDGSDSYADLRYCNPSWAESAKFVVKIGNQSFYKVELP